MVWGLGIRVWELGWCGHLFKVGFGVSGLGVVLSLLGSCFIMLDWL